jgi:hypothetical protein
MKGPYNAAVLKSRKALEMDDETEEMVVEGWWNLHFKYPKGDLRYGIDDWWPDYDNRINTIYGRDQRAMFEDRADLVDSEHILFPGNVAVVADEDQDLFLLLCTWADFAHTPGTAIRNTFAFEGIYLNGTTIEMYLPSVHQDEIDPFFHRMDAKVDSKVSEQLKLVAFASRAILATSEIMELLQELPARDQYDQRPVTIKTLRLKNLQYGMTMSLSCPKTLNVLMSYFIDI